MNSAPSIEEQQAKVAELKQQLPREYQVQIQDVVNAHHQQLTEQGHAPEVVQEHVWKYYCQCVESFHQQYTHHQQLAQASQQSSEQPAGETLSSAVGETAAASAEAAPEAPARDEQAGRAEEEASSTVSAELRAAREAQAREQEARAEEEFQERLKKMDPTLAARLVKQREKERTGAVVENIGSAASKEKQLDPVLAKRWAAMENKPATERSADPAAKDPKEEKPWEVRTRNSELGQRWAQQEGDDKSKLAVLLAPTPQEKGQPKPWEERTSNSELGQAWARLGDSSKVNGSQTRNKDGHLAQRDCIPLAAGQTFSHVFKWPGDGFAHFQWNVVVLDELTVDLEAIAVVTPSGSSETRNVVLQKHARGSTFVGSFYPQKDRRLRTASGDREAGKENVPDVTQVAKVQEIRFEFSNRFSWFTAKDIELIVLLQP